MDMHHVAGIAGIGGNWITLFQIGVERVVHRLDRRVVQRTRIGAKIIHRVGEIAFKPIDCL